jgi:hypothetical protein
MKFLSIFLLLWLLGRILKVRLLFIKISNRFSLRDIYHLLILNLQPNLKIFLISFFSFHFDVVNLKLAKPNPTDNDI